MSMNFRLLRVKRRADQDPASALYLPVEDIKKTRTDNDVKEFRLFKIVERGNLKPTRILKPTKRENIDYSLNESKVILLSDKTDTSTVADAILFDNKRPKSEISEFYRQRGSDLCDKLGTFNIEDDAMNGEFVYDVYRLDLGRFTSKDLEGKINCIEIVTYEQEFLTDEEESESETYEDEEDSNAEDFFANDYPDEESYISDKEDYESVQNFIRSDDDEEDYEDNKNRTYSLDLDAYDNFIFDESIEVEDLNFDEEVVDLDGDFFDLDHDDYNNMDSSDYTDSEDENKIVCYSETDM